MRAIQVTEPGGPEALVWTEVDDPAAATMLQGMTAHFLACSTFPLESGHRCLIHAGAGGVGLLLIQIAKLRGAEVFTTVGTAEKAEPGGRRWRRPRHRLPRRGLRRRRRADCWAAAVGCDVRRRRRRHFRPGPRSPASSRDDGHLRKCLGSRAADAAAAFVDGRVAVSYPADARRPHRDTLGARRPGQRPVRLDRRRSPRCAHRCALPLGRRAQRARGPARQGNDRQGPAHSLSLNAPRCSRYPRALRSGCSGPCCCPPSSGEGQVFGPFASLSLDSVL